MHHIRDFWDYFQIAVAVITLIVLIYYAIKTAKIHTEAQKQNNNNICPFLIGHFESVAFYIANYGRGPAVNILIVRHTPGKNDFKKSHDVLIPGDRLFIDQFSGSIFEIFCSNMEILSNVVYGREVSISR